MYSVLGARVYVITRYTEKPSPGKPGHVIVIASKKHDVTEDFERCVEQWKKDKRSRARRKKI